MTTIPGLGASSAPGGGDLIVVRQVGQTVDTKMDLDSLKAFTSSHSHDISDITDLQTELDSKLQAGDSISVLDNDADYLAAITGLISQGTNVTITGTGAPGDPYVISASGGGGSPDWGDIGGTLSDQTDLQAALDNKLDVGTTTTDIGEGSNLYYTNERVDDRVAALFQNGTGITWSYNDGANTFTPTVTITQYTDEMAQDTIAALLQNGTGISWSYNDGANTLTPTISIASFSTSNLSEGSNLYYTDERVDDRVAVLIQNGTGISWSYNDSSNTLTPTVSLASFSTSNLTEGSNLYYTNTRADARIALQAGANNGLATLDSGGKVPTSQLPAIALVDVNTVASQVAQLALTAQEGDVAVRTDQNKSYIHNGGVAGTMADWTELLTPTDTVLSVNGQTGIVSLTTSNISEGSNLYYTDERAQDAIGAMVSTAFTYTDGTPLLALTSRTINGTAYDGTANITITAAAGTLTGTTLNSTVVNSSLTSVGTLTSLTLGGTLAMGANNITMTGSLGTTGSRLTKGWFVDLQVTNAIAGSITGNAATVTTNANLTGDVTSSGNSTSIAAGVIVNADINSSAAIAFSKMATLTASRALVTDGSGFASASSVTSTELGYVSGVTSSIQTQLGTKATSTLGTPQNSTSGTSIDFTGIPSGTKKIIISLVGVSTNGTSNLLVQLGDSGGVETTGYLGSVGLNTNSGSTLINPTTGVGVTGAWAASLAAHGQIILCLVDSGTNTWSASVNVGIEGAAQSHTGGSTKSLSAVLDRVRITTTNGTDTFDAGKINITYRS